MASEVVDRHIRLLQQHDECWIFRDLGASCVVASIVNCTSLPQFSFFFCEACFICICGQLVLLNFVL